MHINVHVAASEGLGLFFCQNSRTLNRTLQRRECDHSVRVLPLLGRAVEMSCLSFITESRISDCPGQLFACVIVYEIALALRLTVGRRDFGRADKFCNKGRLGAKVGEATEVKAIIVMANKPSLFIG